VDISHQFRTDRSAAFLILSNLVTILFAVVEIWDVGEVMLIYWGQSVVIGLFNFKRILDLKQFSTKNFKINDQPVEPTTATKRQTAWFFLLHYGFFHFVYFGFLSAGRGQGTGLPEGKALVAVVLCVLVFLVNHAFSYRHNRERDAARVPNIGTVMFFPYARIIPMHLTIIFGSLLAGDSQAVLVLFLGLKTVADFIMHAVEHAEARRPGLA
jgi:hypothetical protein